MIKSPSAPLRQFTNKTLTADLVITGGGLSGVCASITAARQGIKVILVQDRPVLGGNSSSEVRLWILGATSHMGNNNRWSREGGVIDEILIENMYRNPEGNPIIFDTVLLDKVVNEPNIILLLNTAVHEVEKSDDQTITALNAFCSQNQTTYKLQAPLFCDASGDGVVGFLAGAAFRMGAESQDEFGEQFAPAKEYGELLGHTLYFYSKDVGHPVSYIPPSYALTDITKIPRFKTFNAKDFGCRLWWIEYGGRLDTVHDTEAIKWELWKVVYGVWNHIKNSGNFPEAANLTLEWVGTIPGKRESRRFEGDYMIIQQDLVEQRTHDDAVAFGGWSIDLHPADGVFSEKPGCNQWHSKGIFGLPYRSMYSKNITNLLLAGRIISASHVAFGSTRVMATAAHGAQAAAMAAVICKEKNILPAAIIRDGCIEELQQRLLKTGQHIPGLTYNDHKDLVQSAVIHASSELVIQDLTPAAILKPLEISVAQMLPLQAGKIAPFEFYVESATVTELVVELRISSKIGNYTPDITLSQRVIPVNIGSNKLQVAFDEIIEHQQYVFITILKNPDIQLHYTDKRVTGLLTVFNGVNKAVSNNGSQLPPEGIGMEAFEFWCPQRRPAGENLSFTYTTGISGFEAINVKNGIDRPTNQPNAWVADWKDEKPTLNISWQESQEIKRIDLFFDTDYDHPMESVLMSHPENVMPFCVRNYTIKDAKGNIVASNNNNYQTYNSIILAEAVHTHQLMIEIQHPSDKVPAAIFGVRCYQQAD